MTSRIFSAVAALSLFVSVPAFSRDISMLTVNWAPHYGEDLPEQGLTTALVKAAFEAGGHNASVDFIPWTRALKEVEEGKADIVMGAYFNEERNQTYIYSNEIYSLDLGIIARPGLNMPTYSSLRELADYEIGITRGFANSEEFDAAEYLDKHVVSRPVLNIRKLFRGRIDLAVMNFDLFRYHARQEDFNLSKVSFLDPPLKR